MKLDDKDFNTKQLDVEYERSEFKRYDGDIPRTGTILQSRVTKVWWTYSGDGTSAMKVLAVAEGNVGDRKKYNGLPIWDFLTFKPEAAFRYMPFLMTFEITVQDIKRRMIVANEDDNIGTPIESIGDWVVGSDDALCRVVVRNNPQYGAEPDREGWLPLHDEDTEPNEPDDDDEDDDEPPARPTRRSGAKSAASSSRGAAGRRRQPEPEPEDEDDDDEDADEDADEDDIDDEDEDDDYQVDEDEDDEPEDEPPARPTRAARSRTSPAPARGARAGSARGRPAARSASRSGDKASASRAATRDRKGRGSTDDPPF
jgi:hypothetical protein